MRWNLRMKAAERGLWKSTELRRLLAAAGLEMSAGRMSGWWTGTPKHGPPRRARRDLRRARLRTFGAAGPRAGQGRGAPTAAGTDRRGNVVEGHASLRQPAFGTARLKENLDHGWQSGGHSIPTVGSRPDMHAKVSLRALHRIGQR